MKVTRRDLLVWSAGAAAGLMVTPVPWKLLDDTSIWSQNWPWIPQPTRGPVEVKHSSCTLCPNGCGMRVRMAGRMAGRSCGVAQSSGQPRALCPLGFRSTSTELASAAVADGSASRRVLLRGTKRGRLLRKHAAKDRSWSSMAIRGAQLRRCSRLSRRSGAEYRVVLGPETRALAPYETWSGVPAAALGYDLENAQTDRELWRAVAGWLGHPGTIHSAYGRSGRRA